MVEEIVVDRNGQALAGQREEDRGYAITLDEDYAGDLEQIVGDRKPWIPRSWE